MPKRIAWNKGLKMSDETRNKISLSMKKKFQEDSDFKKKISKGWGRKPKTGKDLICPECKKEFYIKPSGLKKDRKEKIIRCSRECYAKSKIGKLPANLKIAQSKSSFQKAEKNINWKGGIDAPYPEEWDGKLKNKIWKRDFGKCQECHKQGQVIHHIDFDKKNCNLYNLILLCRKCHMKIHWQANIGVPGLKNWNLHLEHLNE